MIELRLDYLKGVDADAVRQVIAAAKDTGLPVLATCRASWEGGAFEKSEKSRQAVLKTAVRAGADLVDIEAACRADGDIHPKELYRKDLSFKVIRSNHDFERLPGDFAQRVARIEGCGGDVGKIAVTAERITDCFAVLDLMHAQHVSQKEFIAIAMGEAG